MNRHALVVAALAALDLHCASPTGAGLGAPLESGGAADTSTSTSPSSAAPGSSASSSGPGGGAGGVGSASPSTSESSAAKGCIDDVAAGHHVYTCSGIQMDVEIPPACAKAGSCGLIVDAHGMTMNAQMEDDNTNMRALGAQHGYIVVQPNARGAPSLMSWSADSDDPVLAAFIPAAITALAVNPKRVHFAGFSDGGEAAFRFLCKHADLFASVAPAAGEGCTFTDGDRPSREIPVLYMHGTQDGLVDFQSNAIPQRDAIITGWNMGAGVVVDQGAGFVRTRWTSPSGTVFELLQHDYEADSFILRGHCYPGSQDKGDQPGQLFPLGCVPPNAFTWGEEVVKFFLAHE